MKVNAVSYVAVSEFESFPGYEQFHNCIGRKITSGEAHRTLVAPYRLLEILDQDPDTHCPEIRGMLNMIENMDGVMVDLEN